jgi:hypothetical protein
VRFSLRLSIPRARREIKIRMIVEVVGMPRYAGDTLEMINERVMDGYLSAELERLLPDDSENCLWDTGAERSRPLESRVEDGA